MKYLIKLMVVGLLIITMSGICSATITEEYCWTEGDLEGIYSGSNTPADGAYWQNGQCILYHGEGEHLWCKYYLSVHSTESSPDGGGSRHSTTSCSRGSSVNIFSEEMEAGDTIEGIHEITGSTQNQGVRFICAGNYPFETYTTVTLIIANASMEEFTVSGTTGCVDNVYLYYGTTLLNTTDTPAEGVGSYSYEVLNGTTYRLLYDSFEYEFTVNGENIEYNRNNCIYTHYRLEERCGNLIPDSEGIYVEWQDSSWLAITPFYAPSGIFSILNSIATGITVESQTFIGKTRWGLDPITNDTTYALLNPNIAWGLKIIVQNESDDTLIDDAMVRVEQGCYCTGEYSTRQKMTVNGMVEFGDMSLQDASLHVTKAGYKFVDENSTGYNVFLSGRTNFSSKTWIVKLAPNTGENASEWYEVNYSTGIHFKDINGNRTSQILDSDSEVYLYYENNNSENEAMTLKFQSSSTHSYFIDEDSWNIPAGEIGHKTIPQAKFTPWNYAYRAVIYNSSIYGWNITIPLTVRNETKEETLHYENLTTNLGFLYANDGKIDYRENMEIATHAYSNNTTLMNIDLEIWKDGALLCYKNLSATDYAGADYPYYYIYEPVFEYVSGSNYTAKMYGFDRTLLEVRFVNCIIDTITRQNKLTIGVKDRVGANLDNCYIYLEDWGSLPTGSTYYNSYEGISNGYYRYKATKSGYSGSGWSEVTMADGDQIVWYTLTEDHTNMSATQQKLSDDDVKTVFFPLMFFLLICLVFGGFKYVTQ